MGYTKTNHQNALMKLLKEKGIILQIEAARRFNMKSSSSLNSTIEKLEQEGKLKRTKVKIRCKNGNLNDAWLLYLPNIDYNKVLDYEKELVNQPFESPLKEHHCYKKIKDDDNIQNDIQITNSVVNIQDYITVNNYDLAIKEYKGVRVVSSYDIAKVHNKETREVNYIFKRNIQHFIEGIDYFVITRDEAKSISNAFVKMFTSPRQNELFLFTETGYMLLVKPFEDDLSWNIQRELVNSYFKIKKLKQDQEINHLPQIQNIQIFDVMEMMIQQMRQQNERIDNLENKINAIAQVLIK